MTRNANYFKLGLFILVSFTLGAVFLIIFGAGQIFKKELLAETCFNESVQGLNIGSEVKYKGIKIGTVKDITSAAKIYHKASDYVLVIISLEEDISLGQTGRSTEERIKKSIAQGLTVRLSFKGLTGAAYLETDYAPSDTPNLLIPSWDSKNTYIPSKRSSIKQYGDALNQILDNLTAINIKGITRDIERLLKTLDQKANDVDLATLSRQTSELISELQDTNKKIGSALESEQFKDLLADAQASFSDIRQIVETAKPPLKEAVGDFKIAARSTRNVTTRFEEKLSPRVDSLTENLDKLINSLAATSTMLENAVWLNSDKIKLIIDNLETTSENLKQTSRDIKLYPGRLLFQKQPDKDPLEDEKE